MAVLLNYPGALKEALPCPFNSYTSRLNPRKPDNDAKARYRDLVALLSVLRLYIIVAGMNDNHCHAVTSIIAVLGVTMASVISIVTIVIVSILMGSVFLYISVVSLGTVSIAFSTAAAATATILIIIVVAIVPVLLLTTYS